MASSPPGRSLSNNWQQRQLRQLHLPPQPETQTVRGVFSHPPDSAILERFHLAREIQENENDPGMSAEIVQREANRIKQTRPQIGSTVLGVLTSGPRQPPSTPYSVPRQPSPFNITKPKRPTLKNVHPRYGKMMYNLRESQKKRRNGPRRGGSRKHRTTKRHRR